MSKPVSKNKINKAGELLANESQEYDEAMLEAEIIFDDFRASHLLPLTSLTLTIQGWLATYSKSFYLAQRLKRKPQILRKLRRFRTTLTRLQDIGGCRIIVAKNNDVGELLDYLSSKFESGSSFSIKRITDYREKGRDDSGYRAVHCVINSGALSFELQIRSSVQHYWAESIERTSVVYGHRLKEQEGQREVLMYFKKFSDLLHDVEVQVSPSMQTLKELERQRVEAEEIILKSDRANILSSHVNESIVKSMAEKEKRQNSSFNNWILVFDWSTGNFVTWDTVQGDPKEAAREYARYEKDFPEEQRYEVVLVGSSDISTVQHTHSHYFGIDHHDETLEKFESSIIGISRRTPLDAGEARILNVLATKKYWGNNKVKHDTLKNHFCKNVAAFDESMASLFSRGYVIGDRHGPLSLNPEKNAEIENHVA